MGRREAARPRHEAESPRPGHPLPKARECPRMIDVDDASFELRLSHWGLSEAAEPRL